MGWECEMEVSECWEIEPSFEGALMESGSVPRGEARRGTPAAGGRGRMKLARNPEIRYVSAPLPVPSHSLISLSCSIKSPHRTVN